MYGNSGWGGDHIDIQVKRRLAANEVLILAMGASIDNTHTTSASGATISCAHHIFVRTLVGNL